MQAYKEERQRVRDVFAGRLKFDLVMPKLESGLGGESDGEESVAEN